MPGVFQEDSVQGLPAGGHRVQRLRLLRHRPPLPVGRQSVFQGQGEVRRERGEEHGKDGRQGKDQRGQRRKGEREVAGGLIPELGKNLWRYNNERLLPGDAFFI